MSELPPGNSRNVATELAKERNRAAAERTLMAWIRTCLSLISFGFGIDRVVAAIDASQSSDRFNSLQLSRILGLAFIALGTLAMLAAAIEHQKELAHIRKARYLYQPRRSLGLTVAIGLILIGAFAFTGIVVKSFR